VIFLWALWALADGAAILRQASTPRIDHDDRDFLRLLGGFSAAVGVLAMIGLALGVDALSWLLVVWFVVRAASELLGAFAGRRFRLRALLVVAGVVDLVLAYVFVTHAGGAVVDIAQGGGGLASLWGAVFLGVAVSADNVRRVTEVGPRLLSPR
jgi:uncharacterized membrane protein HdeD (DUF308 family)